MCYGTRSAKAWAALLGVLLCTGSGVAGNDVLPSRAAPYGFSLFDMAFATAVYNTGVASGNPLTPPPPPVPFEILVGDATVGPNTIMYVPVFFADDSGGAPAGFPKNVLNQRADARFLDNLVASSFDVEAFIIQVDGNTTALDDGYISGTYTFPLLDGTPAGTRYIVSAAFLSPLEPGNHTVGIGGIIDGEPVVFASYNVKVVRGPQRR
jgi:hypothetical protein